MPKVDPKRYTKAERKLLREEYLSALQKMEAGSDCIQFLSDLHTESEFVMFARRLQIAKRLLAGLSYLRIRRELRVGLDTIQAVHEWLESKFEDYRCVIPPLFNSPQAQWERALRRAYSPHYLLLKLLCGRSAAERILR
jgi:uncharacterized protein YerC